MNNDTLKAIAELNAISQYRTRIQMEAEKQRWIDEAYAFKKHCIALGIYKPENEPK